MSKKVKVLISVLVTIVLLTMGGTATVMAQEEPVEEEPVLEEPIELELELLAPCFGTKALLAEVAELLGMTSEELIDIFKEAQQELKDEAFIKYVEKAAEEGIISPEEAEEIIKWWEDRPGAVGRLFPWSHILPTLRGKQMMVGPGKVTEKVFITPNNNAEQIKLRLRNKLNASDQPVSNPRIFKAPRVRQQIAVSKGWQGPRTFEPAD